MNSYGIVLPTSREEYNALVETLEQTIFDTARASLYIYQKVVEVNIVEIEGITPREDRGKKDEQKNYRNFVNDAEAGVEVVRAEDGGDVEETGSLQCTFQERQQCCSRDLPPGEESPVKYCKSLGCNFDSCRRIRFDIKAEQLLTESGGSGELQSSATDNSMQTIVDNLYDTITSYVTEQVDSGDFTIDLRENAKYCGGMCLVTLADASVTNMDYLPANRISIAIPTPAPTKLVTRPPQPPPSPAPLPTYLPTTGEPTVEPTYYYYPTQSPTLFVSSSWFIDILVYE